MREFTRLDHGACLLLIGRQGIGKSRLLGRFVQQGDVAGEPRLHCVLHESYRTSSCLHEFWRLESAIANHPTVRTLTTHAGAAPFRPRVDAWIHEISGASDWSLTTGAGPSTEDLIHKTSWNLRPAEDGEIVDKFLSSLRHVSRSLPNDQRLALLIDPGANFDEGSTNLRKLRMLYDVVRNLPPRIVFIVALRDDDPAARDPELPLLPNVDSFVELEPFSPHDVHTLLQAVLGEDVTFDTAHRVHKKYGGDPLSIGLLLGSVLGEPNPSGALLRCPKKIHGLMSEFYQGFDPLHRRLLRVIAISDEPVDLEFILALMDARDDLHRERIEEALRSPYLTRGVVISRSRGVPRFRIYHEAFASHLRDGASPEELAELSRRAGKYHRDRGRWSSALYHFGVAGDRNGVHETLGPGLDWLLAQGENKRLFQIHQIVRGHVTADGDRFLLGKALAWARSLAGETEEVVALVEELLAFTSETSVERAELLLLRGDGYHNSSRYRESYQDFEDARAMLEELGEVESILYRRVALDLAHMQTHLGDFRSSEALHYRLLKTQPEGPPDELVDPEIRMQLTRELRRYGEMLVFTGEWEEAERLLETARKAYIDLGHRRGEGDCLRRLADLYLLRGGREEYLKALKAAKRAQALLTEVGSRSALYMGHVIGQALCGLGRMREAEPLFTESIRLFTGIDGSPHLLSMAEVALAECERLETGAPRLSLYCQALARYEELGVTWGIGTTLIYRGIAYLATSQDVAAEMDLSRADAIFTELDLRPPREVIARVQHRRDLGFHPIVAL